MATHVFNAAGEYVSQGRNLAVLFAWARRAGGVTRMTCHTFPWTDASYPLSPGKPDSEVVKASRPTGFLIAHLANGYRVETWFCDGSHLLDWANARVKPRRNSWFSGAIVEAIKHDKWANVASV